MNPEPSNDGELLRRYVTAGSDAAFAELVRRHVNMVYSTALRRVNGETALAEDITQSVFTDLARKAGTLGADVVLGGWLHRHTRFTASKAIDRERRRRAREQVAATMNALTYPTSDPAWRDIAPLLDDALDHLHTQDRDAIVLRFFERRELRAVGQALGVSDDTAQKRVARALDKLRAFLARRGVTSTAGALSTVLISQAVTAAPSALAATLPGQALAGAAANSGPWFDVLTTAGRLKLAAVGAVALTGIASAFVIQQLRVRALDAEVRALKEQSVARAAALPAAVANEPPAGAPTTAGTNEPATVNEIIAAAARELRGGAQSVTATTRALALLSRIPINAIPDALELVGKISDPGAQPLLFKYLLGRWAETKPWDALRYSQTELPMACRPGVYEGILTAWAGKNPESAFAWFQKGGGSAPAPVRDSLLATLFRGMASQDLGMTFNHYTSLETQNEREQALRGILQVIVTADDRQRALDTIAALPDGNVRVQARRALVEHWATDDPQAAAAWVEKAQPAWERAKLMDSLGLAWLQNQPQQAADWWIAHAPGSDTLVKIMNVWAHTDANAAGAWLGKQPRGPQTDTARLTFARQIAETDAVSAFAWADTITDPSLQESTVDHIFRSWRERDPPAAADFAQKASWSEERRARLQKLAP